MTNNQTAISIILTCIFTVVVILNAAFAVSYEDYANILEDSTKIKMQGFSQGDRKELDAYLYKAEGDGPNPALIALHGAGGIFPYQLWWAVARASSWSIIGTASNHQCVRQESA